jgi:DNA invertase Pin-like site-specific DNA recombinase
MNNLKYCRYARKSSEAKEKQALSIQDQNLECEKYEKENDLKIIKKIEEAKSAYKPHNRPEFNKMIKLFDDGIADGIITWKLDRLARNPEEGGVILQKLQDGIIKEIRTSAGDIYTSESDHLILQIHFGMSNQFSRTLSQNVKRGLIHKAERGEYPFPARIGYEGYGDVRRRFIRPHPFQGPIIKEMFNMAKTGQFSLRKLADYGNGKGLIGKTGKKLHISYIYQILTDPTYYGCFYFKKQLYQGTYEPLISKTIFDEVQIALKIRSKPKNRNNLPSYNGLVHCKECACAITTTIKTKFYKRTGKHAIYSYNHCTHKKGICHQEPITTDDLELEFFKNISLVAIGEDVWRLALKLAKEKDKADGNDLSTYLTQLHKQTDVLQGKLTRLIDMRSDNELTKEEFASQKEGILQEQAKIKSLIKDNEDPSKNWLEPVEDFINTAFYARDMFNNGDLEDRRDLVYKIGENLFLKDEKLIFSFKKPYDVLLKVEYRTDGQAHEDSNLKWKFWRLQ